jgi:hypothetical protein
MGGILLDGRGDLRPGDSCRLEILEEGRTVCRILNFRTRVVRADADGCGLEFVHMDDDGHAYLQTMVLYNADDPLRVVGEFKDNYPDTFSAASC